VAVAVAHTQELLVLVVLVAAVMVVIHLLPLLAQ
jgi:hypothetical protein